MIRSIACLLALLLAESAAQPGATAGLTVPSGFSLQTVASVAGAREIAALPGGALAVGTRGRDVFIVPDAQNPKPQAPRLLVRLPESPAAGVTYSWKHRELYLASEYTVYALPYPSHGATPVRIARVRTGPISPGTDGDVHLSTSVAFDDPTNTLYVSVGSSCNACVEADPTRAAIFSMNPDGRGTRKRAERIRNAIALTVDPNSGALWAGDAGQDDLPSGHPYEFVDDVTAHAGIADYGWPNCEENHRPYVTGAHCADTVQPLIELPAYSTPIGATFYPTAAAGRFAFPARYRGGLFVAAHGSWHRATDGDFAAAPMVAFVPMRGDRPVRPVDWNDPTTQWNAFVAGFQSGKRRRGRPTGITVGTDGSLFVADDYAGAIYRIRPAR
jgi:glucose/arabinose dehydrogenase